jgi:serine/threonine-protein kinase HipA
MELKEVAKNIIQRSVTVPGVQAKLSLQLEKSRKEGNRFTMVGLWGNYILKPPVEKYPELQK